MARSTCINSSLNVEVMHFITFASLSLQMTHVSEIDFKKEAESCKNVNWWRTMHGKNGEPLFFACEKKVTL